MLGRRDCKLSVTSGGNAQALTEQICNAEALIRHPEARARVALDAEKALSRTPIVSTPIACGIHNLWRDSLIDPGVHARFFGAHNRPLQPVRDGPVLVIFMRPVVIRVVEDLYR